MPKIKKIQIQKALGFRGSETIRVRVIDELNKTASALVALGKSKGSAEVKNLEPTQAIAKAEVLSRLLAGTEVFDQTKIDRLMVEFDGTPEKSQLGGNVILGTSWACARLGAVEAGEPLWGYLRRFFPANLFTPTTPRLLYNLVEGGVHAENQLPLQEHLVIPPSQPISLQIEKLRQLSTLVIKALEERGKKILYGDEGGIGSGFETETEVFEFIEEIKKKNQLQFDWGIDSAANNIKNFNPEEYQRWYQELAERYPLIYLEDPFQESGQDEYWQRLFQQLKEKVLLVGDDLTVTNPAKLRAVREKAMINALIIKPDQVGSLTETLETIRLAREKNFKIIVSHRSQETTEDYLADLAIAVGAEFVKFGAFSQGERLAKYNRLLAIEEEIAETSA